MPAQRSWVRYLSRYRHDIAYQLLMASGQFFTSDDSRLRHSAMLCQYGLDLARLDAEAANFDLVIETTKEIERAIGTPLDKIAAAVHAAARGTERVGNEAFGRQAWSVEIAARQPGARNVQFTRHPNRHRL
jgi:hypothetical protein